MYLITVKDLDTGHCEEFVHENVERTVQTARIRVDAQGPGTDTPVVVSTGVRSLMIKAFSGPVDIYEDIVLYRDLTNGEPGDFEDQQEGE